jgi:TPR repeat protein
MIDDNYIESLYDLAENFGDKEAKEQLACFLFDTIDDGFEGKDKLTELTQRYLQEYADGEEDGHVFRIDGEPSIYERAALLLGTRYYGGSSGFPQDFVLARKYYEKAAVLGNDQALCNLGYIYFYGRDVERDYERAYACYLKSANKNNPNAMFKVGDFFYEGIIKEQDYDKAFYWYSRAHHFATEQIVDGRRIIFPEVIPSICYRLGRAFLKGQGVDFDPLKALDLLQQAEIRFYEQVLDGDPFASETLEKTQKLISSARRKLNAAISGLEIVLLKGEK